MLRPQQVKSFLTHPVGIVREFAANFSLKALALIQNLCR